MPARLSSMEISSPDPDTQTGATRRKSGRVVKKPEFLAASSPTGSAKRKRTKQDEGDVDIGDDTEEEVDDESEGEPDEEEVREKKRAKKGKKAARKPAPKKSKTNGETVSLAIRPAAGGKAKKPRKARPLKNAAAEEAEGLYGKY